MFISSINFIKSHKNFVITHRVPIVYIKILMPNSCGAFTYSALTLLSYTVSNITQPNLTYSNKEKEKLTTVLNKAFFYEFSNFPPEITFFIFFYY